MGVIPRPAGMKPKISGYNLLPHYCFNIIFHNSNDTLSNHIQV
jgi:hypothetical protein